MKTKLYLLLGVCLLVCSVKAQTYFALQKKLDGGYYQMPSGGILYFKFTEEYTKQASSNLNYVIYKDNQQVQSGCSPSLTESFGDNRFQLNLGPCSLTTGDYYIIEVFNEKKERWIGRFRYK